MFEFFGSTYWWIFPLLMIFLCFFMMRGCMGVMRAGDTKKDTALHILQKRYARGEINRHEYEEIKASISIPAKGS
jgi:uncharacterized membrane protein